MRICVIGGGVSGIVTVKELIAEGLTDVVGLDGRGDIGGMWESSERLWQSLNLNTSAWMTEFSDTPIEREQGASAFLRKDEYLAYLKDYAARYGVTEKYKFRRQVQAVVRKGPDEYIVRYTNLKSNEEERETFSRVVVACGVFGSPKFIPFPEKDKYQGKYIHAHNLLNTPVDGKTVAIIGNGITGTEVCSLAASRGARLTYICARTQQLVIPKVIEEKGSLMPVDAAFNNRLSAWLLGLLPESVLVDAFKGKLVKNYLSLLAEGRIIEQKLPIGADATTFFFPDGSKVTPDLVLDCGGYHTDMQFLDPELREAVTGHGMAHHLNLYKYTFNPTDLGIAFVGLIRPAGALGPLAELQARWIAGVFSGRIHLPAHPVMSRVMTEKIAFFSQSHKKTRLTRPICTLMEELSGEVGCKPKLWKRLGLFLYLLTRPIYPVQYRLDGHGADPSALGRLKSYYQRDRSWFGDKCGDEVVGYSALKSL